MTMPQQIPISQARARLSELLKKLQKDPDQVFQITVNGLVLGELRAAPLQGRLIQPGQALLRAPEVVGEPEEPNDGTVARDHDAYLYAQKTP
jgi:hypothetical protein